MCDIKVHIPIVKISIICAPLCICSGANMVFSTSGTHLLEVWTMGICTTYEANVYFCNVSVNGLVRKSHKSVYVATMFTMKYGMLF